MNNSVERLTAQQVRQRVREARALRSQALADLPAPVIDDERIADKDDNTVNVEYLKEATKELIIEIPKWQLVLPGREKDLLKVFEVGGSELFTGSYDQDDEATAFPLNITIPKSTIAEWVDGVHEFNYSIRRYNGHTLQSDTLTLLVDTRPPYLDRTPASFPAIPDVLEGNKGTVSLQLPSYPDQQPKDYVWVFWLKEMPDDIWVTEPVARVEVTTTPQDIPIPVAAIEAVGNGGVKAFYILFDKARNISHLSEYRTVGVALGTLPADFEDPRVPLAADGDLIDQADVELGVEVEVDEFDHSQPDDEVQVSWGTYVSPSRPVGEPAFPLRFTIPPIEIWKAYGADKGTGIVSATVAYTARRGTIEMGKRQIEVDVNLERIGPVEPEPDPKWPGPINSKLMPPTITGSSGEENELIEADENKPARISAEIDGAFKENDVVSFYWAGIHVSGADVTLEADQPGTTITASIPWDTIHDAGNGTVKVHYTITRGGVPNPAQSPSQDVMVAAIVLRPDAPKLDTLGGTWLNCDALWTPDGRHVDDPAFRVTVPDLSAYGLKAGDTVTLKWWATTYNTETPIPEVSLNEDIVLDEDTVKGFTWRVKPYTTHILPIDQADPGDRDGYGYAGYEFELEGKVVRSKEAVAPVSINTPTGTCDISGP